MRSPTTAMSTTSRRRRRCSTRRRGRRSRRRSTRCGRPNWTCARGAAAALPFAYIALGLIKQVQQATRLFVAKVGPELPAIDETRRMTGKRDGLEHRDLPPVARHAPIRLPPGSGSALATPGRRRSGAAGRARGMAAHRSSERRRPLAFAAAIDAVRREPGCVECRRALRGLIVARATAARRRGWSRRNGGDAAGPPLSRRARGRPLTKVLVVLLVVAPSSAVRGARARKRRDLAAGGTDCAATSVCGAAVSDAMPPGARRAIGLVVATRGAATVAGRRLVALPEAAVAAGTERVPDLATALRRYAPARLRVVGARAERRDRDAVRAFRSIRSPAAAARATPFAAPAVAAGAASRRRRGRRGPARRSNWSIPPDAASNRDARRRRSFRVDRDRAPPGPALFTLRVRDGARRR